MLSNDRNTTERTALFIQGAVYVVTGIWPIVHQRSFFAVTGPKVDGWLVNTFGTLVTAIGAVLLFAAGRRTRQPEGPALASSVAAALSAAEVYYVAKGRISRVYLLDTLFEAMIFAFWLHRVRLRTGL